MTRHIFTALVHRCNIPMQPLHAADMGFNAPGKNQVPLPQRHATEGMIRILYRTC